MNKITWVFLAASAALFVGCGAKSNNSVEPAAQISTNSASISGSCLEDINSTSCQLQQDTITQNSQYCFDPNNCSSANGNFSAYQRTTQGAAYGLDTNFQSTCGCQPGFVPVTRNGAVSCYREQVQLETGFALSFRFGKSAKKKCKHIKRKRKRKRCEDDNERWSGAVIQSLTNQQEYTEPVCEQGEVQYVCSIFLQDDECPGLTGNPYSQCIPVVGDNVGLCGVNTTVTSF